MAALSGDWVWYTAVALDASKSFRARRAQGVEIEKRVKSSGDEEVYIGTLPRSTPDACVMSFCGQKPNYRQNSAAFG